MLFEKIGDSTVKVLKLPRYIIILPFFYLLPTNDTYPNDKQFDDADGVKKQVGKYYSW